MGTPEGRIKKYIKDVLDAYNVYYFMPVQHGIGAAGVDFHCVMDWHDVNLAFFIEAKTPDKELTDRQDLFLKTRGKEQNAESFVIDGSASLRDLVKWLELFKNERRPYPGLTERQAARIKWKDGDGLDGREESRAAPSA